MLELRGARGAGESNLARICGIDEAGRGCVAGSLFVCGVAAESSAIWALGVERIGTAGLDSAGRDIAGRGGGKSGIWHEIRGGIQNEIQSEIKDSKRLSRAARDGIYAEVLRQKIPHFVVQFSADEIDTRGISKCMSTALEAIQANLAATNYLFDGNTSFGVAGIECVLKGDTKIPQIALASIIAKSLKDAESTALDALYPQYKLAKNKGYGTREHRELAKRFGLSKIHRKTFRFP